MAHFGRDHESFSASRTVQIIGSETNENFTCTLPPIERRGGLKTYIIEVTVGMFTWTVKHRYSEFHELHEKLVAGQKLDKGLLPPKKLFGNQTETFVKKRQQDLQVYLQTVLHQLAQRPPPALTFFLDFHLYEIHGITQAMAEDLYNRGEVLLQSKEVYQVTPLQLHSLTERLKLPEPTCDSGDVKKDLGHILDFITRTRHLQICGGTERVGMSNINMNQLEFDLSLFKSLQTLEVVTCNFQMVQGLETIKQTLSLLKVYRTATTIKEVVLQDVPQWKGEDGTQLVGGWDHVTHADFSHNFIKEIDSSVQILWRVTVVNLSYNQLEGVQSLQWLSHMTHLNLSHNRLRILDSLHTKLGNLKCLTLTGNHIESLHGFSKLFSLEVLDVSDNKIAKVEDVRPVCQLPCLESLNLTENTVTMTVDYRTRILEMCGDRVGEVCLDHQKASQKEKDTVAVRQALQKARDAKSKQTGPRKNSSTASLSDVYGGGRGDTPPPSTGDCVFTTGGALVHSSSDQLQKVNNTQISSSAPHQPHLSHWSSPDMKQSSQRAPGSIFIPGCSSPSQASASSCTSVQEALAEGVDLPSPIPEAHPFDPDSEALPISPGKKRQYRVADLPTLESQAFMSWLEKHLPADDTVSERPSFCLDDPGGCTAAAGKTVVDVMWCYAQAYTAPANIFPCCAVLTTTKLFVERPSAFAENSDIPGIPELRPCLVLPLNSIQHVVVGPCYAYLRVEEAFVGKGGLFTLFALERSVMKRFSEALQDCCTELDPNSPLDVLDLLCQSDLLTKVRHQEKNLGLVSDYLLFALLARVQEQDKVRTCLLVMSRNVIYCIDLSCVYWPPATFQSTHEGDFHFKMLEEISIVSHVTDVAPCSPDTDLLSGNENQSRVDFTPVSLSMQIQSSSQQRQLMFHFSACSSQDIFLDLLSNMREKQALLCVSPVSVNPALEDNGDNTDVANSSFQTCKSDCSPNVHSADGPGTQNSAVPSVQSMAEADADSAISSEDDEKQTDVACVYQESTLHADQGMSENGVQEKEREGEGEADISSFVPCSEEREVAATVSEGTEESSQTNSFAFPHEEIVANIQTNGELEVSDPVPYKEEVLKATLQPMS